MPLVLLGSLSAALALFLGSVFPLLKIAWAQSVIHRLMSFASGVLLGTAFIHLLPDASAYNARYFGSGAILSFLLIFAVEHFTLMHACYKFYHEYPTNPEHLHTKIRGNVSFLAFLIHSFLDGLILATSFTFSASLGAIVSFAVLVHQFPAGLSIGSIFLGSKFSARQIGVYSLIIALFIPIGTLVSYAAVQGVSKDILGAFMGFSAGSFIFIGATDILPEVHEEQDLGCFLAFLAGIGVMALGGFVG